MALASQPIAVALPNKEDNDFYNGYVSFSPRNLFAGSPMSFKMGSLQNRFYPGASPGQSLNPIAIPDLKRSLSGSYDRPDAALFFNSFRHQSDFVMSEEELCKNYTCCGQALPDLHALVDHFESSHVLVDESELYASPPTSACLPSATITLSSTESMTSVSDHSPPAFDVDDMDISEPSPSPPPTPASANASHHHTAITTQSAFEQIRVGPLFRPQHHSSYSSLAGGNGPGPNAFNRYAGYSDYSSNLPGTDPSPTYHVGGIPQKEGSNGGVCMPTALIFSSSAEPTPLNTPVSSRTGSPEYHQRQSGYPTHSVPNGTLPLHPASTSNSSASSFRIPPQSSSHRLATASSSSSLSAASTSTASSAGASQATKPFRCPKPGCNKSYKQQNGLKYHLSHGQCNFAPRDPEVEKLSEVERDKRLKPFVCKVGTECNRRYKNMNGLRYHYTHTGEHGQMGLDMLNRGIHPLPDAPHGSGHVRAGSGGKSASTSAASTPMATPTHTEFPRTTYFATTQGLTAPPVMSTMPLPTPVVVPPSGTTSTTVAAVMQGTSSQMVQSQPQTQLHQFWVKEEGMIM